MRRLFVCAALMCIAPLCTAAPLQVTGKPGYTLSSLVGSETLITVVLKAQGAEDPNLRLQSLSDSYFVVLTESNKRVTYPYDMVASIRVQDGMVEKSEFKLNPGRALTANDQEIIDRAMERLQTVYSTSRDNQRHKVTAATLLALNGDAEAEAYLDQLINSNDLATRFDAARSYYLLGKEVSPRLIREGLDSGNRRLRGVAAMLAGLTGSTSFTPDLMELLNDRMVEHSAPAAIALAHLGNKEAVPQLLNMLGSLNSDKNDAAVKALTVLGGDDVIAQLEARASNTDGQELYRIATILNALGVPSGPKYLKTLFNESPTLAAETAIQLTRAEDYDAEQYLRDNIKRRVNQDELNLVFRARNAAALVEAGDSSAQAVFQQLLRLPTIDKGRANPEFQNVKIAVFDELLKLGDRSLLIILYASLEESDTQVAIHAANAAIAMVNPEYRERYLKLNW